MPDEQPIPIEDRLRRAQERLANHDFAGAIADLTAVLDADPRNIRAFVLRAQARAPGDLSGAMEDYARAAAIEPSTASEWEYRGLANEILGRSKQSFEDHQRARGAVPAARPSLMERLKGAPMTWVLLAVNVAVMACFPKLLVDPRVPDLLAAGALDRLRVWSGEYWRLVTAMFLHVGVLHLVMNMAALLQLCTLVEKRLGKWKMLASYLLTGIAGSAASLLGHAAVSAGASGALFGIEGVILYAVRDRLGGWAAFFQDRGVRKILQGTGVWLLLGSALLNMDNYAHFGGLFFGFVVGWLFLRIPRMSPGLRRLAWTGSMAVLLTACVAAAYPRVSVKGARLYEQGRTAFRAGKREEAEKLVDQSIAAGYSESDVLLLRANLRRARNDLDGAMQDYQTMIRVEPLNPAGHWGRADVLAIRKDYAAAVPGYTEALRLYPENPDLLLNRASAYRGLGDSSAARSDIDRALRTAPRDWEHRGEAEKMLAELR